MKKIKLSKNKGYTMVDDLDFELLNKRKWSLSNSGYAYCGRYTMHRFLMHTPKGMDTDHLNGNKLDNRRDNLRICTKGENRQRGKLRSDNSSGFQGVLFDKKTKKWKTQIVHNRRFIHLGYFIDLNEAIISYNQMAKELFGKYAKLNVPIR